VREAVFNALDSLGAVDGARALDAFAGSGALGLEALSRGARHVTFAEVAPASLAVVRSNVAALGFDASAEVLAVRGERALAERGPFDLVLLDPPYAFEGWSALLDAGAGALSPDGLLVVESDHEVAMPEALRGVRSKAYGGTVVQFAAPAGAPS
jgi:16S rRNA (guanine966-N2)-methyltransferase